jgi:hypothetical protein
MKLHASVIVSLWRATLRSQKLSLFAPNPFVFRLVKTSITHRKSLVAQQ